MLTALLAVIVRSSSSSFIVGSYFTDTSSCASGLASEAVIAMDKCMMIPSIPPSFNLTIPFSSMKASCTQNADGSIAVKLQAYAASSSCSGLGVPITETIPAGCSDGGAFSCKVSVAQEDAVTAAWPALGLYFGDAACKTFDVMVSGEENKCVGITSDESTSSLVVSSTATSLTTKAFNSIDCSGAAAKEVSINKDSCTTASAGIMSREAQQAHEQQMRKVLALFGTLGLKAAPAAGTGVKASSATVYMYGETANKVPGMA